MRVAVLGFVGIFLASVSYAQMEGGDYLVATKDNAYLLMPPEVVSGGLVEGVNWSSDGAYVLVQRMVLAKPEVLLSMFLNKTPSDPASLGKVEFSIYDVKAHRLNRLSSSPMGIRVMDSGWLHGAPVALACLATDIGDAPGWEVVAFDALQGKSSRIAYGTGGPPSIFYSPVKPMAVLSVQSDGVTHLQAIGVNQRLSPSIDVNGTAFPLVDFDERGFAYLKSASIAQRGEKPKWVFRQLNFVNGQTTQVATVESAAPSPPSTDLRLDYKTISIPAGLSAITAHTIALVPMDIPENDVKLFATVTADGRNASISPRGDAVLYVSQECAYIRSLLKVPKETVITSILNAQKAQVMNDSKQAVLAAIMYANDYEDTLPEAGRFYEATLPYVKNRNILDRFVYTFGGGSLKDIQKPAETEIGYVLGPGGRAVAYADGHVKWLPNP